MSDEAETGETTTRAAAAAAGGLRDRVSRAVFRRQVRAKLEAELQKRAKKRGAAFGAAAVPQIVAAVDDAEIDRAERQARAEEATMTEAAVGGPILDWIKANPELVARVVQLLLSLLGV